MHPTTTLIQQYEGPARGITQQGVLAVSSRSIVLVSMSKRPAGSTGSSEMLSRTVSKTTLVQFALTGLPTCLELLKPGMMVVGDSMAGKLHH